MDMEKQELSLYVKLKILITLCFVLVACGHENKTQNYSESNIQEKTDKEYPCPSEKLPENPVDSNVFEKILSIYIEEEEISGKNFIYVSSNCWSDSTYLITLAYYNWNNKADSVVFKTSDKITSFKNILICLDIIAVPSVFPVSHSLVISDNNKNEEGTGSLMAPYNEYFNGIHFAFSPNKQRIIEILKDGGVRPHKYKLLFKSVNVM